MNDIALRVENLSKVYRIGRAQQRHDTLRDAFVAVVQAPLKRLQERGNSHDREDTIWALKDVSFEVKRGEVLGIIGRNGAGKTTLLKILSRITEPTEGRAIIRGRVGSLLEVGTGFHPELTGRENIYLSGAILGMRKAEIDRKFDEIVAFAEVERFLDTPVKRYSSGMYVRLAFAVAAHLEPEILLVDEVLAVGDAGFQKKCLRKMSDVADEGRTVLFVSHNMAAVDSLCDRCVGLRVGRIAYQGDPTKVIQKYLAETANAHKAVPLAKRTDRMGSGDVRFRTVRFLDCQGREVTQVRMGAPLTIEASYEVFAPLREPVYGFLFADKLNRTVLRAYSHESHRGPTPKIVSAGTLRCRFERLPLMYGVYSVHLWVSRHRYPVDYVECAATLEVLQADVYGTGRPPDANNGGICFASHTWDFFND